MSLNQELSGILNFRPVRLVALAILFVGVGTACFVTKFSVLDLDVWWHLATGDWIVQHHAVPHTGILSRTAAERPWMAYSWVYEVLLSRSYSWLGFLGIGLFGTVLTIAVAAAVFWMIRRLSGRFWIAWLLSIVAYFAFLFNIMPRPVFVSMLLFAIMLTLLVEANRTGRVQLLYLLPLIFLLWANVHVQFIYGLFVLGLFAGVNALQWLIGRVRLRADFLTSSTLQVHKVLVVVTICVIATCIGPYTFHIYKVVFGYASSKIIFSMLTEMQALSFGGPSHFVELLLAAAAFFVVGWQKKIDPFRLALIVAASILGFRMTRDAWFLCISAAAVIADGARSSERHDPPLRIREFAGIVVAVSLLLVLVARNTDFDSRGLDRAISGEFPVDAVNFVRKHPVAGPLYNSFDWGGFLIFYMPDFPVSIDGRTDLYGDALDAQFYSVEGADPSYATDSYLSESGVVILKNKVPLAKLLPTDRRFRVIYHDDLATVFARN